MPKTGRYNITGQWSAIAKGIIQMIFICLPVLATVSDYGITFDEPIYMEAARDIRKWHALGMEEILTKEKIDLYWKTDPSRNIHPSGVKWLYLIAQKTLFWDDDPYRQNRVLNIFIFSLSLIIFLRWWGGDSFLRGAFLIILLLTMPRFFAHIHFSATDIPMISFLLFFIVALDKWFLRQGFWIVGILFGVLVSIKITAILLAFPLLIAFMIWNRDQWKTSLFQMFLICFIGLGVFYILNPDWWHSTLSRGREFIFQTMTRGEWTPFTVYFEGKFYNYRAPFYYPFTMFFITTPVLHLLFLVSGLFFSLKRLKHHFDRRTFLILTGMFVPFLILTLPISPAHDGIRYLLPAFPFAACFMTTGLETLWRRLRGYSNVSLPGRSVRWVFACLALLFLALDAKAPTRIPPFELSYYNFLVGGLSGAHARGYETTYWLEVVNGDVLKSLNRLVGEASVYFPLSPTDHYLKDMQRSGSVGFRPTKNLFETDFVFILGRPFVDFWERKIRDRLKLRQRTLKPIWGISIDGVPLINLYKTAYGK